MWMAPFDPSRDFIARGKDLLVAGRNYQDGEPFDKSSIDIRLLRQLYEARRISYTNDPKAGNARIDPLMVKAKAKPTEEELAAAEAFANATGNTKKVLLEQAKGLKRVHDGMNKKAIALELIRAGRGPA